MLRPSVGSGLVISWAGMRGILSLAAAMALPAEFPYRDLIVLTAFAVVLGTLTIQGLTLKPLLRALDLQAPGALLNTEILALARRRGASLVEVGVSHYPRPVGEQSGGSPRVVLRALGEIGRLWWRMRDIPVMKPTRRETSGLIAGRSLNEVREQPR